MYPLEKTLPKGSLSNFIHHPSHCLYFSITIFLSKHTRCQYFKSISKALTHKLLIPCGSILTHRHAKSSAPLSWFKSIQATVLVKQSILIYYLSWGNKEGPGDAYGGQEQKYRVWADCCNSLSSELIKNLQV